MFNFCSNSPPALPDYNAVAPAAEQSTFQLEDTKGSDGQSTPKPYCGWEGDHMLAPTVHRQPNLCMRNWVRYGCSFVGCNLN